MNRSRRELLKFLQTCTFEWAQENVYPMMLGIVASLKVSNASESKVNLALLSRSLISHLNGDGVRVFFNRDGSVRAYVLYEEIVVERGHVGNILDKQRSGSVQITDFYNSFSLNSALSRRYAELLPKHVVTVRYSRHQRDRTVMKEMSLRRPVNSLTEVDREVAIEPNESLHSILNISNIANLFEDSFADPQEIFSRVRRNADLGSLLLLLFPKSLFSSDNHYESITSLQRKIMLRQYHIFRDTRGVAMACITWAWVSSRTLRRLRDNTRRQLSIYELNDGDILLIEATGGGGFISDCEINPLDIEPFASIDKVYFRTRSELGSDSLSNDGCAQRIWEATSTCLK